MKSINLENLPPPQPFPIDALPPELYELAMELHWKTKAPIELIVASILGAISVTCQNSVDVRVPVVDTVSPVTLCIMVLANSGERKTTVDKLTMKAIRDFEAKQAELLKPELIGYEADYASWNIERKTILKTIEKAIKISVTSVEDTGQLMTNSMAQTLNESAAQSSEMATALLSQDTVANPADKTENAYNIEGSVEDFTDNLIGQLKAQFVQHLSDKPIKPRQFKIIYDNSTPGALFRGMVENGSSAALVSDEADKIINGHIMNDLAQINSARDGSTLRLARVVSGCAEIPDPRLTFLGMIQPGQFEKYFDRRGEEARDIGFFSRCFFCFPSSTQGTRFILNAASPSTYQLQEFQARMTALLESNLVNIEDPAFSRHTLEFGMDAKQLWVESFNEVESQIFPGQYYADISDYGSKFAENLARLAGLFHYFLGKQGDISYETTKRALVICRWYMTEFKRIFSSPEVPLEVLDAKELEAWLVKQCYRYPGWTEMKKNVIAQLGPNQLRSSKIRREAALCILAINNKLRIELRGKATVIVLNPAFFPIQPLAVFPPYYQPQLQRQMC